jgi:hypothetical protein
VFSLYFVGIFCKHSQALLDRSEKQMTDILIKNGKIESVELIYLTIQIISNCPPKSIPNLLSVLTCSDWKNNGTIDPRKLFSLRNASQRTACGKPIKKGDILWTCRQCAHDSTCVQCDDCFQKSDHKNHEVYFHKSSSGGGCCDCGDAEAWNEKGNCTQHGTDKSSSTIDPTSILPTQLVSGLSSVLSGICLLLLNLLTSELQCFLPPPSNPYFSTLDTPSTPGVSLPTTSLIVRLYNDDHHSYDQVIDALR